MRLPGADNRSSLFYRDADDPDQPGSGSLQFSGARRGAYLRTVEGAPMDAATFTEGYTIEAFVRLPEQCCGGDLAWMGVLSRLATGADAGKSGGWNPRAPAATLSLSPSRQLQWEMFPTNSNGTITNWGYDLGAPRAVGGQCGGLRLHLGAHEVHDRLRHLLRRDRCRVQEAYQQEGERETELVFITSASPRFPKVNRGENEGPAKQLRGPLAAQGSQAPPLVDSGVLGDERQL